MDRQDLLLILGRLVLYYIDEDKGNSRHLSMHFFPNQYCQRCLQALLEQHFAPGHAQAI